MALIPPLYLDSVVSIEVEIKNPQGILEKKPIATGFLIGEKNGKQNEVGDLYNLFLVTNRHVFEKPDKTPIHEVYLRFNTEKGGAPEYFEIKLLDATGKPIWLKHDDERADIAIIPLNVEPLKQKGIQFFFFFDKCLVAANEFVQNGISVGDGLFVLGFPKGIRGEARNAVIVRQGIIARVDEELLKQHYFFIDSVAYPGNSGGPVVSKPELTTIAGTKNNTNSNLIGLISKGEVYSDVAISQQTGEPKIVFTEQMGLIRVVPIESVLEVVRNYMKNKLNVVYAEPKPPTVS